MTDLRDHRPRYVVLGLARARAPWFAEVARWATSATLPATFVKCISVEEVRARLASGRPYSALVVDAPLGGLDRDLTGLARRHGCAVVAVSGSGTLADAGSLGVAACLPPTFSRAELLDALASHARLVDDTSAGSATAAPEQGPPQPSPWSAPLIAVCGPGGTGASTVACALSQGLAADPRVTGLVALADLALHADQAVLHGTPDVVPGLPELVEAHRRGRPEVSEVRHLTFPVDDRGYHLLLGIRRHRDWAALRSRAVAAALEGLRQSFRVVVADVDADVEGEEQCGAADLDDRNLLARTTVLTADVVVVVAGRGLKGLHALVRTLGLLNEHGVVAEALLPVFNQAPRRPSRRAELSRALAELSPAVLGDAAGQVHPPLFLPERHGVDDLHRDGLRLPGPLCSPVARAVQGTIDRSDRRAVARALEPVAVAPGSLGTWHDEREDEP
jgi:hypothetical protein